MIHIALQKAGAENLKPFLNFSEKKFHLCRARNTQSNACVRSGIMAQELVLTEKELAAAFYYLQQHFEAFQMTLIVFNNNIALNADIRAASNKYRQNFDIPSALRKQQLQQELTPLWTAPATATTFESLLAAIGNSEQLGLRPPQAACLHAISQQPAQTERLLVSVLPTGVGKTRIEAMVAYASQAIEPKNHTIIISPTRHLTQQLKDEFAIEQQKMASRGSYQVLSVYSGSRANSGASSLGFVLDNNSLEQSHSGTIFVFCKASFMELLKIAQDKKTERYNAAYNLLNRVKTIIFDEEHISFDKRIAEQLNALKKQHTLNSFSYLLGFTATSPAELDYQIEDFEEPVQESVAPRSIIYSYSDEAATQNGYIRPIHTASIRTSNISTLFNRMTFTDGTSLNEHIGIIVCQSQQQLNWVEQQIQNNRDLKLQCFSIYSNKPQVVTQEMQQPGYYQKNNEQLIAEFKAQQRGSVALVIDMLREGFNHPPCCYTINLKKKMSLTDRTQRGGRCRRKINEQDNQVALFIDAILTDFRQPKRPYNKRARNDTVIDDITEKAILDADMMDIDSQNMLLFQSQNSTDNNDTRQFKKLRLDTTADDELVAMDVVEGQQSSETPNRHRR
jgi:superfamily II DNA or RNA helicase